ncbi:hypothetical protein HID58_084939, partial [Brassica napus]
LSNGGDHERFKRRDPLNSFTYYNGSFDATAFTGIHGYSVAGVLLIAGVCFGLYLAFSDKRRRVSSTRCPYLDRYYLPLFLLLLLFMFLSMAASGIVIAANQSSKNRTEGMKETTDKAGEDVDRNIRTVITSLTRIQYLLRPYDQKTTQLLNVTSHRLRKGSLLIQSFVHTNSPTIDLAINISPTLFCSFVSQGDILVCSNGAIPIGEFPKVLSRFTCHDKVPPETCRITGKFIPEAAYLRVYAYSDSAQGMLDILPSLQNLTQCLYVKDTLSSIVSNQCKPLRASMYRLWASMLALSLVMKVMVLLFLAKAFQEKGKSFAWFSIYPTSSGETRQNCK